MNGLKLFGHPLHPAIVHFPVAGWTAAVVTDALFVGLGDPAWWKVSQWLLVVGVVTALGAMTAGFLDLMGIPAGSPAQKKALRHLALMSAAWTIYAVDLVVRLMARETQPGPLPGWLGLAMSAAGFLTLMAGARVGAQLVYDFGVGQTGRGLQTPGGQSAGQSIRPPAGGQPPRSSP